MSDIYYISDDAYEYLTERATENNFVRPNSLRRSGISRFFNKLAWRTYTDRRPDNVRDSDSHQIARKRVPIWMLDGTRKARFLDIDEPQLLRFMKIAIDLKITMGAGYKGGPLWKSTTSVTGAVLEAIGIQWLEPHEWPEELGAIKAPLARAV